MASELNNDRPLVSVIIPFLNGSAWLSQAVESVIAQTYTEWEIVLVDDGSANEATATALSFAERSGGKIIYAEHPGHINRGVTASRNLGISRSGGQLIALLDSDDCWLPNKLEQQVSLLNAMPEVQVICEASTYWFSWENQSQKDILIPVGAQQDKIFFAPKLMYEIYPLGKGAAPCPSGMILRRDVFNRIGGFEECFKGSVQVYEDQAFLSKIYLNETVYVSSAANNLYRQRGGSLMQSIHQKNHYRKVRAYFLKWLIAYLKKEGVSDARLNRMIRLAQQEVERPHIFALRKKIGRLLSRNTTS